MILFDPFDACLERREAKAAREKQIAARVREVATELGAVPGPEPGEWQLKCPHCGQIVYMRETQRCVFVRALSERTCPATALIASRLRTV
jgi:hypothetical protein